MYTGPKDWGISEKLLSTKAYEKILKHNVDLELSFNHLDMGIEKTLNTSKSAIFADSGFYIYGPNLSNYGKDLVPCLVRR